MKQKTILATLEPEVVERLVSRREAVISAGKLGLALASAPVALGALASNAFGQGSALPQQIVDVLNFALLLEENETEFYRTALRTRNLVPRSDRKVFERIFKNEDAHVKLLRTVLGDKAIPKPTFDHTGGGTYPDVFTNYQTFTGVSQSFEETGVRAYKGQAGNLMSNDKILTTALQIHSVEARHVSEIRRLRGQKGWITGDSRGNLPASAQPTYDGEGNTTQGGVNLANAGIPGVSQAAITEAFDEPLTKEEVTAIVRPFVRSGLPA